LPSDFNVEQHGHPKLTSGYRAVKSLVPFLAINAPLPENIAPIACYDCYQTNDGSN
jgi:hypothetical protein